MCLNNFVQDCSILKRLDPHRGQPAICLRPACPTSRCFKFSEFFVGQFSQNPYVRGAYGNAGVGSSPADFHNLQGRLGNLFFSGEATDEEYWGYTQGGYLTGLKQAKQILKCSNGLECPEYHPEENDMCPVSPADRAKSSFVVAPFVLLWLMLHSDMIA